MQQSKSSQSSQPNPNPDHDRMVKPVVCRDVSRAQGARKTSRSQETERRSFHEEAVKHDRTVQPVVGRDASHEPSNEQSNEVNIDFRIPGLPHSVVKQAQNFRVRELVKKIENHPDRHALQPDLLQDTAYNPFSTMTKQMIQDVGNVELFELFETDPKTLCTECLSYWSEGIVYCTCGQLLKETVHGHRYGKTPEKKEFHLVHNMKKRCIKRGFTGIHDRFLRDHDFRKRMLEHDRYEDVCLKWDDLAEQDFTYRMSESEHFHYRQIWLITLNKPGNNTQPLRKRSDFNQAFVYIKPFTPRSWRTTTQTHALLEVPATAIVIDFFLHLVAMEWILVVFLRIQRKSTKEDACKGLRSNGATRHLQIFGENLRRMAFTNFFCFVADRSFTADGGLL